MKDGMSQVSVNDMALDNDGFVWIGTADGLNRYDGNEFKQFKHVAEDSTSISGNYITKILTLVNGSLLIGTRDNGLNVYDPLLGIFRKIRFKKSDTQFTISGLALDDKEGIWVSTINNGMYYFKSIKALPIKYLEGETITGMHIDEDNTLWVGCLDGTVKSFSEHFNWPKVQFKVSGNVQAFFRIGDYLLIGTYEGLFKYTISTKEIQSIELENSGDFKTMHVLDFLKEDEDHVWIATGRGVYLYNLKDLRVKDKIEYNEFAGQGLSNNTVQALLKVSEHQLLVGTANELNCIDFNEAVFKNISKNKKGHNILNDNVIFSVYKDNNGLWVGTSDGGLNIINKDSAHYYMDNQKQKNSIAGSVVRSIVHDSVSQCMWFATTRGLSRLNLQNFDFNNLNFQNFYHEPNNPNSINSNFLKDLVLDKDHNLWGATHEEGIFKLNYQDYGNYTVTRYYSDENNPDSLVNNETNCLELDGDGNIWVGTQNGISRINFANGAHTDIHFTNFRKDDHPKITLAHNAINDILYDGNNHIWMGTRNGLSVYDQNNESFTSWSENNQFPNTLIYCLQDDRLGNVWIGTNDGLVKFNKHSHNFSHYSTADNIQGREFDTHARFRDKEGIIYMGGIDGVTYFNPSEVKNLDAPKKLYFSQLRIKDSVIKPILNKDILKSSIEKAASINIKYNRFPFYLNFSSIDYRLDKNVKYAYKLSPLNSDWNFINDNEIQFLSLPVGQHIIQVNGFSRGVKWTIEPLELRIVVHPPWWFTFWAFMGYGILLFLLVYWFYKFQISRKLALVESKKLKEIDDLKNTLYTNITHEFRTPITVIQGMTENLQDKYISSKPEITKALSLIKANSSSLLKMVNDMLDLTKLESAQLELNMVQIEVINYIKYVFESFESMARDKQIDFIFYSELEALYMDTDTGKLSTILKNLIMNAIKFTPENGKIIAHVKPVDGKFLAIKIIDSGIGIPEEDLPKVFEKFYQVKNYDSSNYGGTGIGLALTKELTNLLGGSITVKSKQLKGSEFIIKLPIANNCRLYRNPEIDIVERVPKNKDKRQFENNVVITDLSEKSNIALIIEDNKDVSYYLSICLEENYKIIVAENGEEGIALAKKFIPDIIISDVMMPKKNGFEVCEVLKSNIITNHIPIILLTAKATDKDKIEGFKHGADAYLIKPFNKEELHARISQLITLRKTIIEKFAYEDFKSFVNRKDEEPQTVFIKNIIETVNGSITDSNFGSAQLAKKLHLSESQLYRKIKATTNRSTAVFIRSIRLNKAKILLHNSDKNISEIAYEVGFNDPSWFSRAFKKEFGFSPSDRS